MFDQQGFFPPYLKIGISYKAKKTVAVFKPSPPVTDVVNEMKSQSSVI